MEVKEFLEGKFYTMNLNNKYKIEKKAIDNLSNINLATLKKIKNYDEIGIVEYVADNNFFIFEDKIYAGWMQINVSARLFDGTIIDGSGFNDRFYEHDDNDLSYIPSLKELKERYGKGLEFVNEFIIEVMQVTDDYDCIIKQVIYGVGSYE